MMVRGQGRAAERDGVAVLERAVDLDRLELRARRVAESEVGLAARLQQRFVLFRREEARAGQALQLRQAGHVIEVAVRGGQDLDITELEAELLDVRLDLLRRVADAG